MSVLGEVNTPSGLAIVKLCSYAGQDSDVPAIELVSPKGEPIARLSTNLPECKEKLEEGEFFAKTWNENESIARACLESGLFEDTGKRAQVAWVDVPVWRIVSQKGADE